MSKRNVYSAYRFWVEIDGLTEAVFSECSGLQTETEVVEWEEGGENRFRHRFPGRVKYANIVLKRGIATPELWKWYADIARGTIQRRNLSVVLYGYAGTPEVRWNLKHALPVKWVGPTFKSGSSEAAVETLELIYEHFERV
ncbi:MAG: phage tail protein [Roseiflexaceae bacterium]|nr:phage tail protein [Roseiflexaceae bacterium]